MVCHRASEILRAEKYQLGNKKETTGKAVVKTLNPKVGLWQKKQHVPILLRLGVVLLSPGLDANTDQVSIALSGINHSGDDHYTTGGNKA